MTREESLEDQIQRWKDEKIQYHNETMCKLRSIFETLALLIEGEFEPEGHPNNLTCEECGRTLTVEVSVDDENLTHFHFSLDGIMYKDSETTYCLSCQRYVIFQKVKS